MNNDTFMSLIESEHQRCKRLLMKKGEHYKQGENRLQQFVTMAELEQTTQAKALTGVMKKQVVTLFTLADRESKGIVVNQKDWDEVIVDIHNYLYLLKGVLKDE